jgi:AcrR family transcriptional regulator
MEIIEKKQAKKNKDLGRKAEIYQKALDLFIKKGFNATPMSEVARVSGISKANLYYYCPDKETLLYEIHMNDLREHFIPILDKAEQLPDPRDRISFFLKSFALMCTSSPASSVLVHEIRSLSKNHQNEILAIWRRAYELNRGAIKDLQVSGKAKKFRESFSAFLGVGMAFWSIYWWDYSRQANAEEMAETLVDIFFNGLLYDGDEKH